MRSDGSSTVEAVERRRAASSLHQRVMGAFVRAAEAQDQSRAAIDTHASVMRALGTTVADGLAARQRRRAFAFRQVHDRKPPSSG